MAAAVVWTFPSLFSLTPLIPFDLRRGVCAAQVNASAVYARRLRILGGDKTYTTLDLNAITMISIIKCVLRARVYRLKNRQTKNRKILKRPFPSVNDALRPGIGNVPLFVCIETRKVRIDYITHYPYYSFISVLRKWTKLTERQKKVAYNVVFLKVSVSLRTLPFEILDYFRIYWRLWTNTFECKFNFII